MKQQWLIVFAFVLLFLVVGLTLLAEWKWHKSPFMQHVSQVEWWLRYLSLCVAALSAISYDWYRFGPTAALTHGVIASAIAWLLVSLLGLVLWALIDVAWVGGIMFFSAAIAMATFEHCEGKNWKGVRQSWKGMLAAVCTAVPCIALGIWATKFFEHAAGIACLFLAVYGCVRVIGSQCIDCWPEVEELDWQSEEYKARVEEFRKGCEAYAKLYSFGLQVKAIYRVRRLQEEETITHTPEGRYLFHGTSRMATKGILNDGFRLPKQHTHGGMFGKGVYFADTPLKSWQYTDGIGASESMRRFWARFPYVCRRGGLILMCWVELGRIKKKKRADTSLKTPPNRTFLGWLRGDRKYTAVMGADKEAGGVLRVPEYIVYSEDQAQVDYVFKVTFVSDSKS